MARKADQEKKSRAATSGKLAEAVVSKLWNVCEDDGFEVKASAHHYHRVVIGLTQLEQNQNVPYIIVVYNRNIKYGSRTKGEGNKRIPTVTIEEAFQRPLTIIIAKGSEIIEAIHRNPTRVWRVHTGRSNGAKLYVYVPRTQLLQGDPVEFKGHTVYGDLSLIPDLTDVPF